MKQDKL
jgi:hypothetical protein